MTARPRFGGAGRVGSEVPSGLASEPPERGVGTDAKGWAQGMGVAIHDEATGTRRAGEAASPALRGLNRTASGRWPVRGRRGRRAVSSARLRGRNSAQGVTAAEPRPARRLQLRDPGREVSGPASVSLLKGEGERAHLGPAGGGDRAAPGLRR